MMMNKKLKYTIAVLCIVVFLVITTLFLLDKITPFDNAIYNALISLKCGPVTTFFKLITKLCNTKFIILATILILILVKNKKHALIMAINVILNSGINTVIKHIFLRPRPVGLKMIEQGGYSFPSGHSMMEIYNHLVQSFSIPLDEVLKIYV